jgi:hypothetical protein
MLKPFQTYIFELQKPYEFRIKLAGTEPTKEVMEAIKNALETYQLESISAVKHLPIQEHREFPNWGGPCDCWTFDVRVAYPTTNIAIAQVLKERAKINPNWMNVRNLQEAEFTDEAEMRGVENVEKTALLDQQELADEKGAQELVGAGRVANLIAELEKHTRKYETAGKDTNADQVREKSSTKGVTTNDKKVPQGNTSTVGTTKNKLQGKRGQ